MLKLLEVLWVVFAVLMPYCGIRAQETMVSGRIKEAVGNLFLSEVSLSIEGESSSTLSDESGKFILKGESLPLGEQVLVIEKQNYITKRYPVVINKEVNLNLGIVSLEVDPVEVEMQISQISLSEDQLDDDRTSISNISGLLTASKDVYFTAAAYDFSSTFFRPRGLGNEYGKVLINGIEMNSLTTGRPEWAEFGGLNDVQRNQVFSPGLEVNSYQFGGIAGTTNSIMRASKYRKGGKISYARANASYRGRLMLSYSSGLQSNGWAYTFLASGRFGKQGYMEGTSYETNSILVSVEKELSAPHRLNFTGFYTPYKRGKSAPLTEEIRKIKGRHYNPNWGYQEGEMRNSRYKEVKSPTLMLNHDWQIAKTIQLNSNFAFQMGTIGNTRIDNGGTRLITGPEDQNVYIGGARNPAPDYFHYLPSYYLRAAQPNESDFRAAYLAEKEFSDNGQMDWQQLYAANRTLAEKGGNAIYVIQNDREDNNQLIANTVLTSQPNTHITVNASLSYRYLHNQNYAKINDLLGGEGYLDIDFYADEPKETMGIVADMAQSDLNHPDRMRFKGDRYKYNYAIDADILAAFSQLQFKYKKLEFYGSGELSSTSYQRFGKFKNGYYPKNSYGKSKSLNFIDIKMKSGVLYKPSGRHMLQANLGVLTQAPTIQNSFSNARQNNFPVIGLTSEKIGLADIGYLYRSPLINGRITGFYSAIQDATSIGFYFAQGLSGMGVNRDAAFVQEITTGINYRNLGVEYGFEAKVIPTITLKAAGSFSQSVYTNNPNLYLTSEDFSLDYFHGEQLEFAQDHLGTPLIFGDGKTTLKNYHVASGPELAYQFGIEYNDPSYWFVGLSSNFFAHAYIDISKIRRTSNFTTDVDGLPLNDFDSGRAKSLLRQEDMGSYMLVNLVGGKSWRVKSYFIGVFAFVNNLLNQDYKTGGFESSRKASYTNFNTDQSAPYGPQFGSRYFYGYGTTFYLNFYVRF